MNQNHKIDMRRPFAAEYAQARQDVRFWDNLKAPSRQGIAMYFEDAGMRAQDIERTCGMSQGTLRHVLTTRGMWTPAHAQPHLRKNTRPHQYAGPKGSGSSHKTKAPNRGSYTGPKAVSEVHIPTEKSSAFTGAITHLNDRLREVEAAISALATEKEQILGARATLEAIR